MSLPPSFLSQILVHPKAPPSTLTPIFTLVVRHIAMFPVSKAAVLKALCIPLCPLAPRRSVVALRSQSAYQSTTAVSSPIEASSAGRPLTWTQQYSRPLSAFSTLYIACLSHTREYSSTVGAQCNGGGSISRDRWTHH
ncbi:hypothetical protein BASA61_007526 [Batrachochytrium salamandrivorans]|nr:hypothetical protein BASA61_007526 [Batrachochytrium salamandrivorans]